MNEPDTPTAYRGPEIPEPLGDQLRLALGLDDRPETFGDWVDGLVDIARRDGVDLGPDVLCTVDESPHRATFDGRTRHYRCVQDPIILPFLVEEVDAVEIRTEVPTSGEPVELAVTETDIVTDPDGVVMSFGVAESVDGPPEDLPSPLLAYGRFCPYGHAFTTREEYEAWAADVDALTMATSAEETLELARALGRIAR